MAIVTMKGIHARIRNSLVNCTLGRVAAVSMGAMGVQLTASGIKDIRANRILSGCAKVSLGILSTPAAVRAFLAQDVHMEREALLTLSLVEQIANNPEVSEKDRELAKNYLKLAEEGLEHDEGEKEEKKDGDTAREPDTAE